MSKLPLKLFNLRSRHLLFNKRNGGSKNINICQNKDSNFAIILHRELGVERPATGVAVGV